MWAAVEIPMRQSRTRKWTNENRTLQTSVWNHVIGIFNFWKINSICALGKNESGQRATEQCCDFAHRCSPGAPAPWKHAPGQSQSSKKAGHLHGPLSSCWRSHTKPRSPWNILKKNSSTLGLWVFITGSSTWGHHFWKKLKLFPPSFHELNGLSTSSLIPKWCKVQPTTPRPLAPDRRSISRQ